MKIDRVVKSLLLVIAVSLSAIALRPYAAPIAVMAQSGDAHAVYIEPGTAMLRAPDGSRQVGQGRRRFAQRKCLGISDYDTRSVSLQRNPNRATDLASVPAWKVRPGGYGSIARDMDRCGEG
jgi:hypothetical protein